MSKKNSITMFGSAAVAAVPDRMNVLLAVEVRHEQAEGAYALAADRAKELIAALESSAPGAKITTTGIGLRARTAWRNDENVLVGYEADTTLQLNHLRVEEVSPALAAAVAAGGDSLRINSVLAEVSDPSVAYAQARELAFADARQKAVQLADLAGCALGRVLRVEESVMASGAPVVRAKAADMVSASMPVVAGEQELSTNLEVCWELVDPA